MTGDSFVTGGSTWNALAAGPSAAAANKPQAAHSAKMRTVFILGNVPDASLVYATSQKTAVDRQQVPSDEAGRIRSQEHCGPRQFLELPETMHGRSQQEFPPAIRAVEQGSIHVGAKHPRRKRVDADPKPGPLHGERFGQGSNRSFAGGVGRNFMQAHER